MDRKPYRPNPRVREQIRALHRLDNHHGWFALAEDWFQIIGSCAGVLSIPLLVPGASPLLSVLLWTIGLLAIASRQRALEHLLHEASHGHLFKNQKLNKWVTFCFVAFPNFNSLEEYRTSHTVHHKSLGDDDDPDLLHYKRLRVDELPVPMKRFVLYYVVYNGIRISYLQLEDHIRRIRGCFQESESARAYRSIFLFGVLPIAGYVLGWTNLLLIWFVPRLFVLPVIRYFGEISKHAVLIKNTNYLHMSRNRFPSFLERYLASAHNDNYHLVHHLFPGIPFYNLPRAHRVLLQDPDYALAHHCAGYINVSSDIPTITKEMISSRSSDEMVLKSGLGVTPHELTGGDA